MNSAREAAVDVAGEFDPCVKAIITDALRTVEHRMLKRAGDSRVSVHVFDHMMVTCLDGEPVGYTADSEEDNEGRTWQERIERVRQTLATGAVPS